MTNKNADSSQAASGGDNAPPAEAPAPAPAHAPGPDPAPPSGENEPAQPNQENSHVGNKVYKSGPLFLSSRGIGWTSWKKRWFILTSTSLVFFRSDPNVVPPKGSEANLTLGGIDLNSSGSVVVKADKKLLTVLFPDGRDGRAFTLKAETSEDLTAWKEALEEALSNAPSASNGMGQNGVLKNDQPDAADAPTEQSKEKAAPKTLVTGRPILLALEDVDGTPSFLEKALRFLEEHGVEVEGILRQAADVEDVERLIREFEQGKKDFSPNDDAHVIADCIKYILRELPSSPVPASCCTALLEASRADRSKRIPAMRAAICETFPEPNRRLLQRILSMMKIVVSHKAVNRMSTSAVAACMAPLLLRPLLAGECELDHDFDMGGDSSIQLMQAAAAANHAQAIVITLLEEYNKFFGEGSNDSGLYSDSEESGSESEELSDDESFEDDEEDDGTEGSYSESYEGSEHASGSFTGTGDSDDDISEEKDDKSSKVDDVEGSELKAAVKSASLLNGPRRTRRSANWGRTPGRKNRSLESIDTSPDDMAEVERLEVSRAELLHKIKEEEKANAVLYENLKKHKNSLHEQRLILEQDVERLHEQLQQERDLRAALEVGLEVSEDASSVDDKVKEELEDISGAKTDVTDTRQNADDLEQSEQNCCLMSDRPQLREQSSNQLKDKHKDAAASMKRSETRNKDQSNRDDEKDSKHESKSQIDSVRTSKYSGYPPTSPSNDSAAGKPAAAYSKRQNSRGEGTTSSNNALSKLTSRLNFLKEKRTQITSDVQNSEKGRSQGQTAQNSESHSSEKSRGSDHIDQNSDKGVSTEGLSTDRDRRSDTHGTPNLERGKSEHIQKGRQAAPARTMSR